MTFLFKKELRLYWAIIKQSVPFVAFVVFVLPFAILRRNQKAPWIISGHKGKLFEDNCKALFQYIFHETDQPIIWISSSPSLTVRLRSLGYTVLEKHSFAARYRIASSPMLIYSHGEDDLDHFLVLLRWVLGKRIFVSHTLVYLKDWRPKRWLRRTDYDYLLSASEDEKRHHERMHANPRGKIVVAGGAHLDAFFTAKAAKPDPLIVYFPTSRQTVEAIQRLEDVISEIRDSAPLQEWLEKTGFRVVIARHVNNPQSLEKSSSDRVSFIRPEELADYLTRAQILISDYSGVLSDFLSLDRPTVFFPFDLEDYSSRNMFYFDYDERRYGPRCDTVDELISFITEEKWREPEAWDCEKREAMKKLFFDLEEPAYASRGYDFLRDLADGVS